MNIKHFYNNISIRYKLVLLYITVIIVCISVFTGIISTISTKTIREVAKNTADQVMISAYRSMEYQINDINYIFATLQANKNLITTLEDYDASHAEDNVRTIDDILFSCDVYAKKATDIKLYALNHPEYQQCKSERVFSDSVISKTQMYADAFANTGRPQWVANDNNYASKSSITTYKIITNSYNGKPLAIVCVDTEVTQFVSMFQNLRLADNGQIFLCTSANHIINPYENKLIDMFSNNSDLNNLIEKNTVNTIYTNIDGDEYMLTVYPLKNTSLFLAGAVKINEFKAKALPLRDAAFLTSAIMALIIVFLLYFVSSYISKPIIYLAKNIDRFSLDNRQTVQYNHNDEIGLLYIAFNDMQLRIQNLTKTLSDSLKTQKKAELKAIQSQISPHFLYNTLNSISALAQKHNIEDIENMTSLLATFFTRTLNNGNTFCTIEEELVHVKSYISIQNIRFSNKFKVLIDVPDDVLNCNIINLTLQPLVENCIVHAFRGKSTMGTIAISGRKEDDDIYIEVADDGLGANVIDIRYLNEYVNKTFNFDEQIDDYGIHNVNQRIKLYYGQEFGLEYSYNDMGGLTAMVHIAKSKKEE